MGDLTATILKGEKCMTCGMVLDVKTGNLEEYTKCKKKEVLKRILEENEMKRSRVFNRLVRRADDINL